MYVFSESISDDKLSISGQCQVQDAWPSNAIFNCVLGVIPSISSLG